MSTKDYFLPIKTPEQKDLLEYLFVGFIDTMDTKEQMDLLKIFDEIENYKISAGKFYQNAADLLKGKELIEASMHVSDILTGLYKEIIIIKKLTQSAQVDNIYEIRMGSEFNQHRIFIFPYDKDSLTVGSPFVTLTYGFDKQLQTYQKGNQTTDLLRDSSQRIRDGFYNSTENVSVYIPDIAQEG